MSLTVFLEHDQDCGDPTEYDGQWTPYSFSTKHSNFRHPNEFDPDEDAELRAQLDAGLAFFLGYFEHGRCLWSFSGEGPQCRWDSVSHAGILVWENDPDDMGAKTPEDRRKDAASFLDQWNAWVNGDCYYFSIVEGCESCGSDDKGEVLESCGGFLGTEGNVEYMFTEIKGYVGDQSVKFKGEAKYLADFHWKE